MDGDRIVNRLFSLWESQSQFHFVELTLKMPSSENPPQSPFSKRGRFQSPFDKGRFRGILTMGLKDFDSAILNPLVLTPGLTLTGDGVMKW
jgi:hypothetical protein